MSIFHIPAYTDNYIWALQSGNNISLIDPGEAKPVLEIIKKKNLDLVDILLTHHHFDHVGGTLELKPFMRGKVYGPKGDIAGIDIHVSEGSKIKTLNYLFETIATPGHTLDHLSYIEYKNNILFCGDTLFSLGCGRLFEGTYEQMHDSIQKLNALEPETLIYCAHEYTYSNLKFVSSLIDNDFVNQYVKKLKDILDNGGISIPTTLAFERKINPFLLEIIPSEIKNMKPLDQFAELRSRKDNF